MLFGAKLFNTAMLNGGTTVAEVFSTDSAVFERFSLNDGTRMVLTDYPKFGPTRNLVTDAVPRGDGFSKTSAYFGETTIELRGWVKHDTADDLEGYLDTIKQTLAVEDGELDLTDANGTVKRYLVTCDNFDEMFADRRRSDVTRCPFVIRFRCQTPFGKARDYSSVFYPAMSTSGTVQSVVNAGTYKARAFFVVNFSAASSVTGVTVTNVTTGEAISYTGAVAAGDVLVFDGENLRVTKGGAQADFDGAFPALKVGANLIRVDVTGTSFTADVTSAWKPTYL